MDPAVELPKGKGQGTEQPRVELPSKGGMMEATPVPKCLVVRTWAEEQLMAPTPAEESLVLGILAVQDLVVASLAAGNLAVVGLAAGE